MCRYYGIVPENYVLRTEATGHIAVILETYAPEAFPYFVILMSVSMLETDIRKGQDLFEIDFFLEQPFPLT
jgi:hypothetical protein